jgi:hypothetical protein
MYFSLSACIPAPNVRSNEITAIDRTHAVPPCSDNQSCSLDHFPTSQRAGMGRGMGRAPELQQKQTSV